MQPESVGNTAGADREPRDNGVLVNRFGAGSEGYSLLVGQNDQVWVKQA